MSNPSQANDTPIRSVTQLAEYIAQGCKPAEAFRIGTEHEKFGFWHADLAPPEYQTGIRPVLEGLRGPHWADIRDANALIGLTGQGEWQDASVSLEPGGQLELSGSPLPTLHETRAELDRHFAEVRRVADPLGLGFALLGFHPRAMRAQVPWMPKSRYAIMRNYMPRVGTLGLDMMLRTCTVQVNLDFASEADMRRKLRVGLLLQPLATALFANSPFREGRPSGFLSTRAEIWTDTDNQRAGIPAVMLEDSYGFERHVEWLLDVPMYFVMREGRFVDMAGRSFRDFMAGKLDPALGGATVGDFADHMTTAFTDVRLKRYLEMRGADAGRPDMMLAQSAFWVGLLYDNAALDAAVALVRDVSWHDAVSLRQSVSRLGLAATWSGGTLRDLGRQALAIADRGLRARARLNADGQDESLYLEPLHQIMEGGPTQAEHWLHRYATAWQGDVSPIFAESAI